MEEKKTDLRVIKTKRAIKRALTQLMLQKDLNNITVKELAETAEINRKTFYNYYSGIYQVMDEIETELAENFDNAIANIEIKTGLEDPYLFFEKLTAIISSEADFYGEPLKNPQNDGLWLKLTDILKTKTKEALSANCILSDETLDIIANFTIPGIITVYQNWLCSDRSCSAEEIAKTLGTLCFHGLCGLL